MAFLLQRNCNGAFFFASREMSVFRRRPWTSSWAGSLGKWPLQCSCRPFLRPRPSSLVIVCGLCSSLLGIWRWPWAAPDCELFHIGVPPAGLQCLGIGSVSGVSSQVPSLLCVPGEQ